MIYILATNDVIPGKMSEYEAGSKEMAPVMKKVGMKLVGQWSGYTGNTNRVYSLYAYNDLTEYQKVRAAREKDPAFLKGSNKMRALFTNQTTTFVTPTELSPMK